MEILDEQADRKIEPKPETALIVSLDERISQKSWAKSTLRLNEDMSDTDLTNEFNNTNLLITSKDGYEMIVKVDNNNETASIDEDSFEEVSDANKITIVYNSNGGTGSMENSTDIRK